MVSLVKDGKVTRGYIGVRIQPLTAALAKQFDLKSDKGALIDEVEPERPGRQGGVAERRRHPAIQRQTDLPTRAGSRWKWPASTPGEKVPVRIWRDGTTKTVEVSVAELPGEAQMAKNGASQEDSSDTLQGVAVTDLNPQTRRQYSVDRKITQGAIVTQVDPTSAAADAGLKEGDVIMEINRQTVRSADDAVRLTSNAKDKVTLLHVWSNQGNRWFSHYLTVDESKAG